jgi:NAD(P)-dependent dehydrogenase (short-subunit alcohol dehydrogenase family)
MYYNIVSICFLLMVIIISQEINIDTNKSVLVTGASRGLGREVAAAVVKFGGNVTMIARSKTELKELTETLNEKETRASFVVGDVGNYDDCNNAVTTALRNFGRLDALVNNAGVIEPISKVCDFKRGKQIKMNLITNLVGPMYLTNLSLPHIRKKGGIIINVSSGAAKDAIQGWAVYSAAKAGLNQFNKVLALEEPRVTSIALRPGVIDTDMQMRIRKSGNKAMMKNTYDRFMCLHNREMLSSPTEIGRKIAALSLFAPREWSGEFIGINETRVNNLIYKMCHE